MIESRSLPAMASSSKRNPNAFPRADREMTQLSGQGSQSDNFHHLQSQSQQQPTFMNFIDPAELRRQKQEIVKKKYEQLLEKIEFYDSDKPEFDRRYRYSKETLMPFLLFTKYLARKPNMPEDEAKQSKANRLKIWIPDTIVFNDDSHPPMWFYSSPEGLVYRTDMFTAKSLTSKLSNYSSPDELVAVVKKMQFRDQSNICGNSVKLVSSRDLLMTVTNTLQVREPTVIQKFVKSNGPKAFICRTVWRKDRNPFCWIITNKHDFYSEDRTVSELAKYITHPQTMNSCTIVNTCRGKYVDETVPYIHNILKYLHNTLNVSFQEFICDFVKDEANIWWMVNVKGFVFDGGFPEEINTKKIVNYGDDHLSGGNDAAYEKSQKPKQYQKVKVCKYCETLFPEIELTSKMTLKMIIQTDKHLMHRGKNFPWLARSEIKQIETPLLYQEHKVCKTCYTLYTKTEKLIQQEFEFARMLGVPCNDETKHSLVSLNQHSDGGGNGKDSGESGLLQKQKQDGSDKNWVMDIAPNTQLVVKNNQPSINNKVEKQLDRYRVMILLHFLRDIPDDREVGKNYFLEYTIFDQKVRYRIPFTSDTAVSVSLNKLRIFYLFTKGRKGINSFVNTKQNLQVHLCLEQQRIGSLELELQDFLSDKVIKREYYKMFSGKTLPAFPLKWGLNVTVGMFNAGLVDVSKIKLSEHDGIYLPHNDYYTCEPLPTEWIQIIGERVQGPPAKREMTDSYARNTNNNLDRSELASEKKQQPQSRLQARSNQFSPKSNNNTAPPGSFTPLFFAGENNTKEPKEVKFAAGNPSKFVLHSMLLNEPNQMINFSKDNSQNQTAASEAQMLEEILQSEIKNYTIDFAKNKKKPLKRIFY